MSTEEENGGGRARIRVWRYAWVFWPGGGGGEVGQVRVRVRARTHEIVRVEVLDRATWGVRLGRLGFGIGHMEVPAGGCEGTPFLLKFLAGGGAGSGSGSAGARYEKSCNFNPLPLYNIY